MSETTQRISDTYLVLCKKLGLGEVTYNDPILTVASSRYWTNMYDMSHIINLQRKHGTGKVNYMPSIYILCMSNKVRENKRLLIVNTDNGIDLTQAKNVFRRKYTSVVDADKGMSYKQSISEFARSSFVIVNGNVRNSLLYSLLSSCTPFILIGNEHKSIDHCLSMCDLEDLSLEKDIGNIVDIVQNIEQVSHQITQHLSEFLYRMKSYLTWIDKIKIHNCVGTLEETTGFPYDLYYREHEENSFYCILYNKLFKNATKGGIHLIINSYKFFCRENNVIFHPWVGNLECISENCVNKLLSKDEFISSCSFCLSLNVYSNTVKKAILEKLPSLVFCINVVPLFAVKCDNKFNYEDWCDRSLIFNTVAPKISIPLIENFDKTDIVVHETSNIEFNYNRIAVISDEINIDVGIIQFMIGYGIPFVCPRQEEIVEILGEDYPLYLDDPVPEKVIEFLDEDNINLAIKHIDCLRENSIEDILSSFHYTSIKNKYWK